MAKPDDIPVPTASQKAFDALPEPTQSALREEIGYCAKRLTIPHADERYMERDVLAGKHPFYKGRQLENSPLRVPEFKLLRNIAQEFVPKARRAWIDHHAGKPLAEGLANMPDDAAARVVEQVFEGLEKRKYKDMDVVTATERMEDHGSHPFLAKSLGESHLSAPQGMIATKLLLKLQPAYGRHMLRQVSEEKQFPRPAPMDALAGKASLSGELSFREYDASTMHEMFGDDEPDLSGAGKRRSKQGTIEEAGSSRYTDDVVRLTKDETLDQLSKSDSLPEFMLNYMRALRVHRIVHKNVAFIVTDFKPVQNSNGIWTAGNIPLSLRENLDGLLDALRETDKERQWFTEPVETKFKQLAWRYVPTMEAKDEWNARWDLGHPSLVEEAAARARADAEQAGREQEAEAAKARTLELQKLRAEEAQSQAKAEAAARKQEKYRVRAEAFNAQRAEWAKQAAQENTKPAAADPSHNLNEANPQVTKPTLMGRMTSFFSFTRKGG